MRLYISVKYFENKNYTPYFRYTCMNKKLALAVKALSVQFETTVFKVSPCPDESFGSIFGHLKLELPRQFLASIN